MITQAEREEWQALVAAQQLDMLPKEALIASVRSLAGRLLEVTQEEAPEVEVTYDRSPVHVVAQQTPSEGRRSGAKNVSAPEYQNAFISEARASMGMPTVRDAQALLGKEVRLVFNVDWAPATGRLTEVVTHPAAGSGPHLLLDNYRERIYPLNSIQRIEEVP